jgi:hypothetical protein
LSEMTAFDWLAEIADHPNLSRQAKLAAAVMSDGWAGVGAKCRSGAQQVLRESGLASHAELQSAATELRRAGYITGRGSKPSPWKLHSALVRLAVMEAEGRAQRLSDATKRLDRQLRIVQNGGRHA